MTSSLSPSRPVPSSGTGRAPGRKRRFAAPIRLREDTGWELRCEQCALRNQQCFWPLTEEFWNFRSMSMCRACVRERQARQKRERMRKDPAFAARVRANLRQWHADNPFKARLHNRAQYLAVMEDPSRHNALLERRRRPQAELYRDMQRRLAYQREWRRRRAAGESTAGIVEWLAEQAA